MTKKTVKTEENQADKVDKNTEVNGSPSYGGTAYSIVRDHGTNTFKIVEVKFNLGESHVIEVDDQASKAAAVESFKISVAKSGLLN